MTEKETLTFCWLLKDYEAATESFIKCLETDKNEPTAMLYYGLSLYHRGKVKVISYTIHAAASCKKFFSGE